jgi:AraC-like DNA-binding protein
LNIFQQQAPPITIGTTSDMQFQMKVHSHSFYEIYYFRKGKCTYLIGDQIYVLSPGDLILMHGLTLHCPNVVPEVEYNRTIIHFDPAYVSNMIQQPFTLNVLKPFQELRNHRFQLQGEEKQYMETTLMCLEKLYNKQNSISYHRFHALFLDLLFTIFEYSQKPMEVKPDFPSIKEHQAKVLFLLEKEKNVTEICYEIGFKHPAHFSRIFKQLVGCTPEKYRKALIL